MALQERRISSLKYSLRQRNESLELLVIMSPVLIHILIFCIIPLFGIVIAFQDYRPGSPFIAFDGSVKWVGLKHLINFVNGPYFIRLLRNTLVLSGSFLVFGFSIPIIFALLVNELQIGPFKKIIQTTSYLPYFISNVIVGGIVLNLISTNGVVNQFMLAFGGKAIPFAAKSTYFPFIYTITNIWKSYGWNSILYLAAMSAIDSSLYEAARMDGANRFQQMRHITIPGIKPTIVLLLIFSIGALMSSNTEMILLLYNPQVYDAADVFGTYVYRGGLLEGQFSFGSAINLFSTVINFMLIILANAISRRFTDHSIW